MASVYIDADVFKRLSRWLPKASAVPEINQCRYQRLRAAANKLAGEDLTRETEMPKLVLEPREHHVRPLDFLSQIEVAFFCASEVPQEPLHLEATQEVVANTSAHVTADTPTGRPFDQQIFKPITDDRCEECVVIGQIIEEAEEDVTIDLFQSTRYTPTETQTDLPERHVLLDMSDISFEARRAFWIDFYGSGLTEAEQYLSSVPEDAVPAVFRSEDTEEFYELARVYMIPVR